MQEKNTKEDEQSDNQIVISLNEQIFSCFLFKIINFLVYSFKKKRILPKGSDTFFYALQEPTVSGHCPTHDIQQFIGNSLLAALVVNQGQFLYQVVCIIRSNLHSHCTGSMF